MNDEDGPQEYTELRVTFSPELYLQRRTWVFEVMRRERVTEILDVGCGEGSLVACLCNIAPWRPLRSRAFPSAPDNDVPHPSAQEIENEINENDDFLHIRRISALDVCLDDLQDVLKVTAPPPPSQPGPWRGLIRWEPLEVNVWHGGMEAFNPEFVGVECIVSTEVIEHLPEELLPDFAPILLGVYHPRLLLITTPSYTFNARFTAPTAPLSARQGYSDPTGRTDRIFRHSDHKFEWTVDEFKAWCNQVAEKWGYEVEISGVGAATEQDLWGRDEELGKASQVAVFKRKEGEAFAHMREERCKVIKIRERSTAKRKHELLATYSHAVHESVRKAGALEEIGELVRKTMTAYQQAQLTVQELWAECEIMCGGWLQNLVAGIMNADTLKLHRLEGTPSLDWIVELEGVVFEQVVQEEAPKVKLAAESEQQQDSIAWPTHADWGDMPGQEANTGWGVTSWGSSNGSIVEGQNGSWDERVWEESGITA